MIGTADSSSVAEGALGTDSTVDAPPADVGTAAFMTTFGTLIWFGPLLVLAGVAFGIVVTCVAIWGEVDTSLWASVVAGWQRWPLGVCGFLMISTFSRMFVVNGVTRRRLGDASTVTLVVLSVLSAGYVTAGFLVERVIYDANDWPQMNDERQLTFGAIGYGTILVGHLLVAAAYFVSGWLVAAAFHRDCDVVGVVLMLPLAALPVVACELLVAPTAGGAQIDALDEVMSITLWAGVPITLAVIGAAVVAARRLTLDVVVK